MPSEKRRKVVGEFVGHIPLSAHEREHGAAYIEPAGEVRYRDWPAPLTHTMVAPGEIGARTHHYDVRFAYEGALRDEYEEGSMFLGHFPGANNFWQRFEPSRLLHFSCTPCTRRASCDCLAGPAAEFERWLTSTKRWGSSPFTSDAYKNASMDERHLIFTTRNRVHEQYAEHLADRDKPPAPFLATYEPRTAEQSRQHYEVDCGVEWTLDGLTRLWQRMLDGSRQDYENELFSERQRASGERGPHNCGASSGCHVYERGYRWTSGADACSTGCNGTHHHFRDLNVGEARELGARAIAEQLLAKTADWPGWRTLYVEGSWVDSCRFSICAYGGKYKEHDESTAKLEAMVERGLAIRAK